MDTGKISRLKEEISSLRKTLAEKNVALEEMKMNNLFLGTLFNGIHEEIMVIDSNFVIQDVNRFYLERYGMKKEDVLGKKCHAVTYQSDSPCVFDKGLCPLEKARETAQRVEVTHFHETEGGESRELVRIVYPLATAGEMPQYFVEISRDVTEYRSLITKLKASERKFRAILDTATDAILGVDKDHKIVVFNNASQRIFGYSRS